MEAIVLAAMRLLEGLFKALKAYLEYKLSKNSSDTNSDMRGRPKHLKKD